MNDTTQFSSEDPQLTAYALGELEGDERHAIERRLRDDPKARAYVESIRATAAQLENVLGAEPLPKVSATTDPYRRPRGKLLSFPRLYYVAASLAAACFAVLVVMHEPAEKKRPVDQRYYTEVNLPPFEGTVAPANAVADASTQDAVRPAVAARQAKEEFARHQSRESADKQKVMQTFAVRGLAAAPPSVSLAMVYQTERSAYQPETGFQNVADHPLSTFSVDVDTASYANVRRFLNQGVRPPVDAVRIEELLNYFLYQYAPPTNGAPFAASMEVAEAPWAPDHRLVRIGLKGREVTMAERSAANLVFLLDVSGSMNEPNKLPLVKQAMRLLVDRLRPDDRVAIVTYAGAAGLALPSTPTRRANEILNALDALTPEGATSGAMGIQLAYDIAKANLVAGGINRVILCTDGDFNVGVSDEGGLTRLIEEKAKTGIFLSVLGFGMGNYQDAMLEKLADKGNGNYGYIDSKREAEKLLVEQINGTLVTIAKDVKLQVEFNPAQVASYRLIGYENRRLNKEDFNNDAVDAGEIGAGHTVTALYEIVPVRSGGEGRAVTRVDPLKYQLVTAQETGSAELFTLKVRYKAPDGEVSERLDFSLVDRGETYAIASPDFKFAAAVAAFGMVLRDSEFKGTSSLQTVASWAQSGLGSDAGGYRHEFLELIAKAQAVMR